MASSGIELKEAISETIERHEARRGCRFRDGALDRICGGVAFHLLEAALEAEEESCLAAIVDP